MPENRAPKEEQEVTHTLRPEWHLGSEGGVYTSLSAAMT
jgi:hypothetical protein